MAAASGGGRLDRLLTSDVLHLEGVSEIKPFLDQLDKVKPKRFDQMIPLIASLGETMQTKPFRSLSPTLKDKVRFIGYELEQAAKKEAPAMISGVPVMNAEWFKICGILSAITNIKNALQVEAVFFGCFENAIEHHLSLYHDKHIEGLLDLLPDVFGQIRTAVEGEASFVFIRAKPIIDYFDRIEVRHLTDLFDRYLFTILKLSELTATEEFKISVDLIPTCDQLGEIMKTADESARTILQILYICRNEFDWFDEYQTHRNLLAPIVRLFQAKGDDVYLTKKKLIPIYHRLVEEKMEHKEKPFFDLFYQPNFLERMKATVTFPWLEEDASAFGLVRKIEKIIEINSDKRTYSHFNQVLKEKGIDEILLKVCVEIDRTCRKNFAELPFPIFEGKPFVFSSEEFLRLKISNYFLDLRRFLEAKDAKKIERLKILDAKKKKGAKKAPVVICKDSKIVLPDKTPIKLVEIKKEDEILDSFDRTLRYLDRIYLEKRVDVWTESIEMGLEYYHFDDPAYGHELSREEMILRHRLPPQMFILAFNDNYSIKKDWLNPRTEKICKKRECCVLIDGRKYILQATVDDCSILFHYYARPIHRFQDYLQEKKEDAFLLNLRSEKTRAIEDSKTVKVEKEGFVFDDKLTVHMDFEGHHYSVACLRN